MTLAEYDTLVEEFERAQKTAGEPCWVVARSLDEALAFAAWCVENGFKEPEIEIVRR